MHTHARICVCVRERERERESRGGGGGESVCECVLRNRQTGCVCVCAHVHTCIIFMEVLVQGVGGRLKLGICSAIKERYMCAGGVHLKCACFLVKNGNGVGGGEEGGLLVWGDSQERKMERQGEGSE